MPEEPPAADGAANPTDVSPLTGSPPYGFEFTVAAARSAALIRYVEYRTGGQCVIGRQSLADGWLRLRIYTYVLPHDEVRRLRDEVMTGAWR